MAADSNDSESVNDGSIPAAPQNLLEFRGRDMLIFRRFRILVNLDERTVVFENCIRGRGFWDLIPLKRVQCTLGDILRVEPYQHSDMRCVAIETEEGVGTITDSDLPNFDQLVGVFRQNVSEAANQRRVTISRNTQVTGAVLGVVTVIVVITVLFWLL